MREFPKGGIIGKLYHAVMTMKQQHIPLHAAYAAYFIILSMFPALLLLLSILRYTGLQIENLADLISDFLPAALTDMADELVFSTYFNASATVVGLSALTALWSASKGIYGLLRGLNAIYGVSEDRGYWYTRGISVVYTFVFFLILLLTLVLHVFGNTIIAMLTMVDNEVLIFLIDLIDLRFFLLLSLYPGVHGASQQAQRLLGEPARRRAVLHRMDGIFRSVFHLCRELLQLRQYLRLRLRHCPEYALAVLLHQHPVLRRRPEPVSEGAQILTAFAGTGGKYGCFVNFRHVYFLFTAFP